MPDANWWPVKVLLFAVSAVVKKIFASLRVFRALHG
jgi:hypothetical protein